MVADAVLALTKQAGEEYFDYLVRVRKNHLAYQVKLADLAHNADLGRIPNPTEKDIKRVQKYISAIAYLQEKGIIAKG